jgi:transcriptional regulator with XRE-family HTH domain
LAERAEVSTKHLGELERGRGNPSLRSIANISAVLGVSLCDLFDYELEGKDENALRKEIVQRLQSAEIDVLRVVYRALKP